MDGNKRVISLDRWFKNNEDTSSSLIREILRNHGRINLNINGKTILSVFVASLMLRGPYFEDLYNEKYDCIIKKIGLDDYNFNNEQNYYINKRVRYFLVMSNLIKCVSNELLRNKIWMFTTPQNSESKYITSDNPVVLYCPKNSVLEYKRRIGLGDSMVQICVPLGRDLMLQIVDSKYWEKFRDIPNCIEVNDNRVKLMNELQCRYAIEFTFI